MKCARVDLKNDRINGYKAARCERKIAREDDADQDILVAIKKAVVFLLSWLINEVCSKAVNYNLTGMPLLLVLS